ncbi:hypothetical protein IWQ56_005314 [Coemansia nantahalensis]|nr:hypothetical protein IWQ56_005314 [Coemansia nantahalensis]
MQGSRVPRVYGHGLLVVRGIPYAVVAMELVVDRIRQANGEDRGRAILRQCPLAIRKAALAVLEAVHRRGACHRDARPYNILFEDDPNDEGTLRPRMIDFSLGKVDPDDNDMDNDWDDWSEVLGLDS